MGDYRLPKRVVSGELKNAGQCRPGGKWKKWTDWSTTAPNPGVWYDTVYEGGCKFMAARVRED